MANSFSRFATATAMSVALAAGSAGDALAEPVDWERLANEPGALNAVATAIAMSGTCQVPFVFDQREEDDKLIVSVACENTGDGAGSLNVTFEKLGVRLFAKGFEFEG